MAESDALMTIARWGLDPARLRTDARFRRWCDRHARIAVDGATLFVRHGDHLLNEDEMLREWVLDAGIAQPPNDAEQTTDTTAGDFLDIEGAEK